MAGVVRYGLIRCAMAMARQSRAGEVEPVVWSGSAGRARYGVGTAGSGLVWQVRCGLVGRITGWVWPNRAGMVRRITARLSHWRGGVMQAWYGTRTAGYGSSLGMAGTVAVRFLSVRCGETIPGQFRRWHECGRHGVVAPGKAIVGSGSVTVWQAWLNPALA